jgi:sulfate adenylyltransferase/3'-phosphoadenosine 5'-phosphosulfate synthase
MGPAREGFVLWFTGLSASGKTTIAKAVERELIERGIHNVQRLDGDVVRQDLTRDLGFSKEDRDENIRRITFVAELLSNNGVATMCSFISPYRNARANARARCNNFIEVYVECPMEILVERDPKGLYKKALAGEITGFTGVDDPYEIPESPEVVVHTGCETIAESTRVVLEYLEHRGLIGAPEDRPAATTAPTDLVDRIAEHAEILPRPNGPAIVLSAAHLGELDALGCGLYSPLTGFMTEAEYERVADAMRLPDGTVWAIPVTLPVPIDLLDEIKHGMILPLCAQNGETYGLIEVKDVFIRDLEKEAEAVYGTADSDHPGVGRLLSESRATVGGDIHLLKRAPITKHPYHMDPAETRTAFADRGWKTVVAFQTRNPIHRAHEYLQKCALEMADGLFINPLIGDTKRGDVPADLRWRCYEEVLSGYYPAGRTMLAPFPVPMRYAGPREAVHHAICRRNYGCTHIIIGRDHAGVGEYYGTYDAQRVFDRFSFHELGITPLKFEHAFYCRTCGQMASTKTCPHDKDHHVFLSGTKVREMLSEGVSIPEEFTRPAVAEILREAYSTDAPNA